MIAVRCNINSERIIVPQTDNVELVLVTLQFENMRVFLCSLYNVQCTSPLVHLSQFTKAIGYESNDVLCFVGDFNLPQVQWSREIEYDRFNIPA